MMKTQMWIARYRRTKAQGSWRWQQRGHESLIAWPALLGKRFPDIRSKYVKEGERREGAIGVTAASRYQIEPFTRSDAERIFGPLIPGIGGEMGPWLTYSVC